MKIKYSSIFAILMFTIVSMQAQLDRSIKPAPGPAPEIKLGETQSFTLDNGLQVFVVENHKLPRVSFYVYVDNDPIYEGENVGYLEAFGDLLKTGTANRSKSEIDEAVDFMGATLSTFGSGIYGASLKKHTNNLLELMSDILLNVDFKQEELDKLRKQAISGLTLAEDNPNAIAGKIANALTYGVDHPYGEFDTKESWERVSVTDCQNFYQTYFRPNKAYLSVVGDINLEEAKKLVEQYFGEWKKGEVPSHTYDMAKAPAQRKVALVDRPTSVQSVIQMVYPIQLKQSDEDFFAAKVAVSILGGGSTGRLFSNLREDKGYTYGAYASIDADKLVGEFSASASVRNEVTDSSIVEMIKELEGMRDELVTEEELRIAKNDMIGSFIRSLESPQTISNFAINIISNDLPSDFYTNYLKRIAAVTMEDVQRAAKKFIRPDNAHLVVVGRASEIGEKLEAFGKVTYYDLNAQPYNPNKKELPEGLTADQVIANYVSAIGGENVISKVKTITQEFSGSFMGQDLNLTMKQLANKKGGDMFLMKMSAQGAVIQKIVFDGTTGKQSGMMGEKTMDAQESAELRSSATIFPELKYDDHGYTTKLISMEAIDGEDVYVVEVTSPADEVVSHYYSAETGLRLQTVEAGETPTGDTFTQKVVFSDYKEVSGIKFPHKRVTTVGPQVIDLTAKEIVVNAKLKKTEFQVE